MPTLHATAVRPKRVARSGVRVAAPGDEAVGWRKAAYLAGAAVTFALAVLGALLPGLPTTPFLLVTSYCLIRSSRRLHERLLRMRVFGPMLRDWQNHRGVRPGVKTKALGVLAVFLTATLWLSPLPAAAKAGVAVLSLGGVYCIARLKRIRPEELSAEATPR